MGGIGCQRTETMNNMWPVPDLTLLAPEMPINSKAIRAQACAAIKKIECEACGDSRNTPLPCEGT